VEFARNEVPPAGSPLTESVSSAVCLRPLTIITGTPMKDLKQNMPALKHPLKESLSIMAPTG